MISFPNAKINLGLNVVSKRPDGYHNIETIFYPIPVKDALEIVRADTFSFTQTGIPVDAPIEKNLVVKALNLLKSQYEIPELEVHLLKAIPFGAGLGGGSADAAFMLKLLNDYCGLHILEDSLEELAYVPEQEIVELGIFDEATVADLRERARRVLLARALKREENLRQADASLLELEGMDHDLASRLVSEGIKTADELGDLDTEELMEKGGIAEEKARALIMAARARWTEE